MATIRVCRRVEFLPCTAISSPAIPERNPGDAPAQKGFAAQLGFRLPNLVISPFTRKHYVSHIPMDHTAIIKFVENRFIGPAAHLTNRDAAQPDLLNFFDFTNAPVGYTAYAADAQRAAGHVYARQDM